MLFSILVTVYNSEKYLKECFDSVLRQSEQDYELVLVDDGSTDGTAEALARETGIHVVTHHQNQGYGAALRSAFQFALEHDYDVLVTIDCDG